MVAALKSLKVVCCIALKKKNRALATLCGRIGYYKVAFTWTIEEIGPLGVIRPS
jgi:hypothetical protein